MLFSEENYVLGGVPVNSSFDEKAELKVLQKEIARLEKVFSAFTKVKSTDTEALTKLQKALRTLPPGETFSKAVEELRIQIDDFIKQAQQVRRESFGRIEGDYIRTAKEQKLVREQARGWRVGPLEFEMEREQSRSRLLYNREVVLPWQSVQSRDDLEKLEIKALSMLEKSKLPDPVLMKVFWNAYQYIREQRVKSGISNSDMVPILDFYREVRAQLVRVQLETKKPDSKLAYMDLPRWAFLYNLDCYRAIKPLTQEQRLGFQTGSQVEVSKGMGFVANGLDAREEYKTFCYVVAIRSTSHAGN